MKILRFIFGLMAITICASAQIPANSPFIRYVGRTEVSPQGSVSFDWTGTYFTACLSRGALLARLSCKGEAYLNVFVNDSQVNVVYVHSSDTTVVLTPSLLKSSAIITVQKRTEGEFGRLTFHEFYVKGKGTLRALESIPSRHIEFIGNSLTCGFGVESDNPKDSFRLETENCDKSYAAIIARYFGADYSLIAHSGQGAVRNYGDSVRISRVNMKTRMIRTFDMDTISWQPSYKPQLVVINLGTNDFSTEPHPYQKEFISGYCNLIKQVKELYGDVVVLCVCPPTINVPLQEYIRQIPEKSHRKNVYSIGLLPDLLDRKSDFGAVEHPNYNGQKKMALTLIPYISTLMHWELPVDRGGR